MPASVYSMAPAKFGATVVPVKGIALGPGVIADFDLHSGNPYPSLVRVSGADAKITLTMPFAPAYAALGLVPVRLTTFELWLSKFVDFIRSASTDHAKWSLAASASVAAMITGATVDQDGDLMATVDIVPLSADGMTHALVPGTGTLPALGSQPTLYTIGPVSINGTVIPGATSVGVDLGQALKPERSDGCPYALIASVISAQPRVTIDHSDPKALTTALGLTGAAISANVVQYFRRYDPTTGLISTGATALSLTMAAGFCRPLDLNAAQGQPARKGVEFMPTSTTTTHPLAVSTTATVPAIP